MTRRVASREGYDRLRKELVGFPHVRHVLVEGRTDETVAASGWFPPQYEEYDVFLIIVDEFTEDLFDAIPNSWHDTPIEVFLNGTRKRLM